ncbi:TrkH family potassium uptake protein [Peptostreptococcus canis]|uniref:Trk family potassium uptake protein n=1 Tax=Peptostreptococcus canis TaxID=1159213 RepID=A0ABR6TLZ7_9FIRM|nr:TrkH family potassium uptake protein [Peptostreptococcus canis]MBC2576011.1 Trk family potassium uptake protein [Peptostreptococcus canis]MBP1997865.1 trk system potassium uptake protein TrkH [Peptostreptococcus canis]
MDSRKKIRKSILYKFTPGQIMVIGFSSVILMGTLLLMMPFSSNSGEVTNFLDSLFTATSAVCVTGLVVVDTSIYWSTIGKAIIAILIQVGGLGFMSITAWIALILGRKINLRERVLIKEAMNQNQISGSVKLVKNVLWMTFTIEMIGAILLSTVFIPRFGVINGIGYSLFHSISAFCNAGFDLMGSHYGEFSSMAAFYNNPIIVFTLSTLVILGGIGYPVMINVITARKFRKISLNSKLVIITTAILLILGTLVIFWGEYNNTESLANMNNWDKFMVSFFQSMTTRTAGFGTIDFNLFRSNTLFILIVLMFIGASPASTGGGIKTTTVAVIFMAVRALIKNEDEISVFRKKLDINIFRKALGVFTIGLFVFIVGTYLITITQGEKFGLMQSAFEVSSAYSTVGLSMAGSYNLNSVGRVIISLLMFAGRVGSLTVFTIFIGDVKTNKIKYPEEKVLIG